MPLSNRKHVVRSMICEPVRVSLEINALLERSESIYRPLSISVCMIGKEYCLVAVLMEALDA